MAFQVRYPGATDFQGISPLLPRTCFIGTDEDPMVIRPLAFESPKPVEGHPELRFTTMQDKRFVTAGTRLRAVHQSR
jgi:hypothetical protein